MTTQPTLELRDLKVAYRVRGIDREVLRGISLSIQPGEAYGLVGESGCGKSTAAFAAMRYLPRNGSITGGSIHFEGKDITALAPHRICGAGMVRTFQITQPFAKISVRENIMVGAYFRTEIEAWGAIARNLKLSAD